MSRRKDLPFEEPELEARSCNNSISCLWQLEKERQCVSCPSSRPIIGTKEEPIQCSGQSEMKQQYEESLFPGSVDGDHAK